MTNIIKLFNDNELYKEGETAAELKFEQATLRNSRNTGILAGVPAPRHIKRGRSVFYWGRVLNDWHAQFEEPAPVQAVATNTRQHPGTSDGLRGQV